ncbi:hypothetical protein F2Q70_00043497 [Brassica cretica]|uniref:Uncharacterized protein n=1 Tax=Brassica cretica TaxID=69181 RepID=A0A8S9KM95_BRACR|nr:hypothetical protein F2Q70_00043497 [Brassica cretica]
MMGCVNCSVHYRRLRRRHTLHRNPTLFIFLIAINQKRLAVALPHLLPSPETSTIKHGLGDEFVSVLCSVTDSPSTSLVFCHRGNICLCSCVHIGKIYKRASEAYEALSTRLGEQKFLFEDRSCTLVFCH